MRVLSPTCSRTLDRDERGDRHLHLHLACRAPPHPEDVVEAFYADNGTQTVNFEQSKLCALLPVIAGLFSDSRVICCPRNPPNLRASKAG